MRLQDQSTSFTTQTTSPVNFGCTTIPYPKSEPTYIMRINKRAFKKKNYLCRSDAST